MLSKVPELDEFQKKHASKFAEMEKWTQTLFLHPLVKEFMESNSEVTKDMIERSFTRVYETIKDHDGCRSCPGIESCPNLIKGHYGVLSQSSGMIEIIYRACSHYVAKEEQAKLGHLIKSHHIPQDILNASFQGIRTKIERNGSISAAAVALWKFCKEVEPGKPGTKGIYLYGSFGVGKSYMMGAATKELAKRGFPVLMLYTPHFFQEIKDSIRSHTVPEKMKALKEVPVLILDDIGAESISEWVRDEVLGAILQYRMSENLPTCYTSNFDYELLEQYLAIPVKL